MKRILTATITLLVVCAACISLSACSRGDVEGGVIYNGVWAVGCEDGVTEVTLRDGTVGIRSGAFSGRGDITKITIPDSVTSVMHGAFDGCDGIISMSEGIRYVDGWAIDASESITAAKLKEGTRGIADEAFYDCTNIVRIDMPSSVTSIGSRAFYGCNKVVSVSLCPKPLRA